MDEKLIADVESKYDEPEEGIAGVEATPEMPCWVVIVQVCGKGAVGPRELHRVG